MRARLRSDPVRELILSHVGAAMAAAAAPLPFVDVASVTAVQIALVRSLAARYGVAFDAVRARSAVLALTGAALARAGASAVKLVPGVGSLAGGVAQVALSGVSTYALGEAYRGHFETRGALAGAPAAELEVEAEALRRRYREATARGREVVRALRRQRREAVPHDALREQRERFERLHRTGILTREERDLLIAALDADAG